MLVGAGLIAHREKMVYYNLAICMPDGDFLLM